MDDLFALHSSGIFLRREALARGYSDRDLARSRRAGIISRIRQGAYVRAETWTEGDDLTRHQMSARAVLLTHPGRVALSHTTAAVEHGMRLWRPDLSRVHLTRLDELNGRKMHDIAYHVPSWQQDDVITDGEVTVLSPALSALGAASLTSAQAAVAILDSALHLSLVDEESLWTAYGRCAQYPHFRHVQMALRLARRGGESVGESLTRYQMWTEHLPEPVLQYKVYDDAGNLIGITDFAWPDLGLLGEFDGVNKYLRFRRKGETISQAVVREKDRENALREASGCQMIRYIWDDIFHPARTSARTRRMMQLGRRFVA